MLKGFKEFLFRGNIIDLAIAVVIGTAFTALVTAVVNNLVNPLVASIGGGNVNGLSVQLVNGNEKSILNLGAIVSAVINFLIVAAVVYFVLVVPMKRLMALRERIDAPADAAGVAPSEDVILLRQIRDLLTTGTTPQQPAPDRTG